MRWFGDERGRGISSGEAFLPGMDALRAAMTDSAWIAEEPEAHLLPHIRRTCGTQGSPWGLESAATQDAILEVRLSWQRSGDLAALRADVMALIGSFVEAATLIREDVRGGTRVFQVTTGMLEGDGRFAAHGHMVRLLIEPQAPGGS